MTGFHWYPGNMARSLGRLREEMRVVDLVVELLDARVPVSSQNPLLSRVAARRERLVLLHKADRADPAATGRWLKHFHGQGFRALPFSVHWPRSASALFRLLRQREVSPRRSRLQRPLRLMIAGIPNVGKSTLINYLVGRGAARTGNRPGITRGRQWVRLLPGIELLDTPGVLWPSLEEAAALPLTAVAALPGDRVDRRKAALWLVKTLAGRNKDRGLYLRYRGLSPGTPEEMLERIGALHGCLLPGGEVDRERAAVLLLRDFERGALGRITLEEPPPESPEPPEEMEKRGER